MSQPVHVVWPKSRGYWDMRLLEDLFSNRWRPVGAYSFVHHMAFDTAPDDEGVVVVLPARHCVDYVDELNRELAPHPWVLLLVMGDEESVFHSELIQHRNIKRWQQLPKPGKHDFADRRIINGYPTDIEMLAQYKAEADTRPLAWFFSGQITHARREQAAAALRGLPGGLFAETQGFTQGEPHDAYYRHMAAAKVVPCPSGAVMPDSFRVAEALEAGCIPVADGVSPHPSYPRGYWQTVFGEQPPFPIIEDWAQFPKVLEGLCEGWPGNRNKIWAWWQGYQRKLAYALRDDIAALRKETPVAASTDEKICVVIPTSPIPCHPETTILDEVVASVRSHLPNAEILILFDGVRPQMEHRRAQYEEYKSRVLWKCAHDTSYRGVLPIVFDKYSSQSEMMRAALCQITAPLVLFMEHDAVLLTTRPIDWDAIAATIVSGEANMVRLYWCQPIHPEHVYLMRGASRYHGADFVRTVQYSQWPNVASTGFYRKILAEHFPVGVPKMIETVMYSPVVESPWERFRVMIYYPEFPVTWVHRNGRAGDPADW